MTNQELLAFNAKGFIPGPNETESQFLSRISAIQKSFIKKPSLPRAHWEWSKHALQELFGFEPESLVAFYSNADLRPWQGAACWINEEGVPELQLREGFRKGHYFHLYSREETLTHESIHAARSAFHEPENEEFFAYASSEKKWRRALGPIIRNPWEVWVLLITLCVGIFWEIGIIASLLWMSVGLFRLAKQHIRRARACAALLNDLQEKSLVRAVLFRLTDEEIRQLAKGKKLQSDDTLRWRVIRSYFSKTATTST
ncbi:MAG TPA: hypothetical protein VGO47_08550 [Chlamydiales bacterium]|jgi:hypothetical protein|nr:hypothetical protein [Chlamydiales bacterium]